MHASALITSIPVELTLTLTGVYLPAQKAPSVRNSPPEEPDEPASIEDIAIAHVLYETMESPSEAARDERLLPRLITHDILEGVDTSEPNVQLLLSNLLGCVEAEASEALFAEAEE